MMEMTMTIPNALSEITLGQFIALSKGNIVEALGLDDETMELIPNENWQRIVEVLSTIPMVPSEPADFFAIEGEVYFINLDVHDMTFEECTILDSLERTVDNLPALIALYTRPAKKKVNYNYRDVKRDGLRKSLKTFNAHGGRYVPQQWNRESYEKRVELFREKMPADVALWVAVYYAEFGIEILKAQLNSAV
jgi:hypothetical protein